MVLTVEQLSPEPVVSQKGEKKGEQWQLVEVAKVNHDWPTAPEFVEALHLQRPLGALDLVGSRQGIGEDIVPTHDELRGQNCVVRPRPMKNPQRNLVEKCRISPPPPPTPPPSCEGKLLLWSCWRRRLLWSR